MATRMATDGHCVRELLKVMVVDLRVVLVLYCDAVTNPVRHDVGGYPSIQPFSFAGGPHILK